MASLKQDMRDELNRYLFEKTKRRPMILTNHYGSIKV